MKQTALLDCAVGKKVVLDFLTLNPIRTVFVTLIHKKKKRGPREH